LLFRRDFDDDNAGLVSGPICKRNMQIAVRFNFHCDDFLGQGRGCVSALDCEGRTIWIADAHRDDGKRFIVHADEKLTAFLELGSAVRACGELF
jgi:hypothetical protein